MKVSPLVKLVYESFDIFLVIISFLYGGIIPELNLVWYFDILASVIFLLIMGLLLTRWRLDHEKEK